MRLARKKFITRFTTWRFSAVIFFHSSSPERISHVFGIIQRQKIQVISSIFFHISYLIFKLSSVIYDSFIQYFDVGKFSYFSPYLSKVVSVSLQTLCKCSRSR